MTVASQGEARQRPAGGLVPPDIPRRRFSAIEFHRMGDAGIFNSAERVELIGGELIVMNSFTPPHSACVSRLNAFLNTRLALRALVLVLGPIRLNEWTAPEPDLALLKPRDDFYSTGFPTPDDVFLVIEVMASSESYDRGTKLKVYARAGLPEVWLVDLNQSFIEVHRRPTDGLYAEVVIRNRGESLSPEAFPDLILEVNAILG